MNFNLKSGDYDLIYTTKLIPTERFLIPLDFYDEKYTIEINCKWQSIMMTIGFFIDIEDEILQDNNIEDKKITIQKYLDKILFTKFCIYEMFDPNKVILLKDIEMVKNYER